MRLRSIIEDKYNMVTALGPQLVIVDVQEIFPSSSSVLNDILKYARGFDEIIYVYDVMSKEEHSKKFDMFRQLKDSGHLRARMVVHEKEFGFIRDLIDSDYHTEQQTRDIVAFMLKHSLHDMRDAGKLPSWQKYAEEKDLEDYDPEDYLAYLPDYIYDLLPKVKAGAHLVGGGRNECLKEIEIVLTAAGKRPKVIEHLTYGGG